MDSHATDHGLYCRMFSVLVGTMSAPHLLWCVGNASSSVRITNVKGMIIACIRRVAPSVDDKCVGVPSSDIDDWDECGVEVPCYAPARTTYKGEG